MLNRIVLVTALALCPLASQAQVAPLVVSGQWEYRDASQKETDEGVNLCFRLDTASTARSPQLRQFGGALCVSNPAEGAKLLGIVQGPHRVGCGYSAKGEAAVVLSGLRVLPEDEMYDERLEARLADVKAKRTTSPLVSDCGNKEPVVSAGFKSIYDAIAALKAHPNYASLSMSDFARIDAVSGLAELDASTQMFLPPGSSDTLVMYTENNVGTPFLTVERFDGRQWRDVSATTLPGYVNRNGSNYYLDVSGGAGKVRNLPARKAWRYSGGRFVAEN
ncbi:hypothetical protein ATCM_18315 [Stenotrophomonas sp. ATCM1_4]|uniref:hypothetical protein n=1 Tax=Stenotrophomonas sp. ATCM1_4 TaxID=2259330 RepID=UPI00104A2734|nr:hypothetical protein [Stenotrophomonas sp. ATCM1_4]TDB29436.1 hypothetical protein ATCM_18315 [Stenotrophomonas sp. ATCM1_4]